MSFFDRLSNGWTLALNSFKVLKENKQLIIFPVLSGISLVLIMGSFVLVFLGANGWSFENAEDLRHNRKLPIPVFILSRQLFYRRLFQYEFNSLYPSLFPW